MPLGHAVAAAVAGQQVEHRRAAAGQHGQQFRRGQAAHARRRQFDGQRHAGQQPQQLRDGPLLLRVGVEVRGRRARPVDEQGHRGLTGLGLVGRALRRGSRARRVGQIDGRGHRQSGQLEDMLAIDVQPLPRGDQQVQRGRVGQQALHQRLGHADQLFAVVQQQQAALAGQGTGNALQQVAPLHAQGVGDGVQRAGGVAAVHQRDEDHLAEAEPLGRTGGRPGDGFGQRAGHLDGQARLAAAAGAQHGDQPLMAHHFAQAGGVDFGAEQARPERRQLAGRRPGGRLSGARGRHPRHRLQPFGQCRQAAAFLDHPVVIEARQQIAAHQPFGAVPVAAAQVALELDRVAGQRTGRGAHAQAVGQDHRLDSRRVLARFEQALQHRQRLAQPVAAHVQRDAGPQQFDQLFARVHAVGRQRKAGQQQYHGARRKTGDAALGAVRLGRAQQAHRPAHARHGDIASARTLREGSLHGVRGVGRHGQLWSAQHSVRSPTRPAPDGAASDTASPAASAVHACRSGRLQLKAQAGPPRCRP